MIFPRIALVAGILMSLLVGQASAGPAETWAQSLAALRRGDASGACRLAGLDATGSDMVLAAWQGNEAAVRPTLAGPDAMARPAALTLAIEAAALGGHIDLHRLLMLTAWTLWESQDPAQEMADRLGAAVEEQDSLRVLGLIDSGASVALASTARSWPTRLVALAREDPALAAYLAEASRWPVGRSGRLPAEPATKVLSAPGFAAPSGPLPQAEVAAIPRPSRPPLPREPRVAVLDFTADSPSHRIGRRTSELSQAAATLLLANAEVPWQWVDRQATQALMDELALGQSASTRRTMRIGAWLGCQLLVRGVLLDPGLPGQRMTIEVVDVLTADVLATVDVPIAGDLRLPGQRDAEAVDRLADAVRRCVDQAIDRLRKAEAKRVVSLLYFRNTSRNDRLNYMELALLDRLRAQLDEVDAVRLVTIRDPSPAAREQDLALLGLADVDPRAWESAADVYIWGEVREQVEPAPGEAAVTDPDDVPVKLSLHAWNGKDEPVVASVTAVRRDLEAALDEPLSRIIAAATAPLPPTVSPTMRSVVAGYLIDSAVPVPGELRHGEDAPEWKLRRWRQWQDQMRFAAFLESTQLDVQLKAFEAEATPAQMPEAWRALTAYQRVRDAQRLVQRWGVNSPDRPWQAGPGGSLMRAAGALRWALAVPSADLSPLKPAGDLPLAVACAWMDEAAVSLAHAAAASTAELEYPDSVAQTLLASACSPTARVQSLQIAWKPVVAGAWVRDVRRGRTHAVTRETERCARLAGQPGLLRGFFAHAFGSEVQPVQRAKDADALRELVRRHREEGRLPAEADVADFGSLSERLSAHTSRAKRANLERLPESVRTRAMARRLQSDARRYGLASDTDAQDLASEAVDGDWPVLELSATPLPIVPPQRRAPSALGGYVTVERLVQAGPYLLARLEGGLAAETFVLRVDRPLIADAIGPRLRARAAATDLAWDGQALWVASSSGLARVDADRLVYLEGSDGLISEQIISLLPGREQIVFVGPDGHCSVAPHNGGPLRDLVIALESDEQIVDADLVDGHVLVRGRPWRCVRVLDGSTFALVGEPLLDEQPVAVVAGGGRFWIITKNRLVAVSPVNQAVRAWEHHLSLPDSSTAVWADDRLWIGRPWSAEPVTEGERLPTLTTSLFVWDPQAEAVVQEHRLPGQVMALSYHAGLLVIGSDSRRAPLRVVRLEQGANAEPGPADDLAAAAFRGDLTAVRRLLAAGQSPYLDLGNGWTPLHSAVFGGHEKAVALMLHPRLADAGRPPADPRGPRVPPLCTPLALAAAAGQTGIVDRLLEAGADPTEFCLLLGTPITAAAFGREPSVVQWLQQRGLRVTDTHQSLAERNRSMLLRGIGASSPLALAIAERDAWMLESLLKSCVQSTTAGESGELMSWLATVVRSWPDAEVVAMVLDITGVPGDRDTIDRLLTTCISNNDTRTLRLLLDRGLRASDDSSLLASAAGRVPDETFQALIAAGRSTAATGNALGDVGAAAERLAAAGRASLIRWLIEEGHVDLDAPKDGRRRGDYLCSLLVGKMAFDGAIDLWRRGYRTDAPGRNGGSALHTLARLADPAALEVALSMGGDPLAYDDAHQLPLHVASPACRALLLPLTPPAMHDSRPLSVDPQSRGQLLADAALRGDAQALATALQMKDTSHWGELPQPWPLSCLAASEGHAHLLPQLREVEGADPVGPGGWTPLMLATVRGDKPLARALVDAGADPHKRNALGQDAADLAAAAGLDDLFRR